MKNYVALIFLFIGTLTFSQTFHLSGKVTDEENTPVDFAEVILSVKDSVLRSELTGEDGSFTFSGLLQENYTLAIKQTGEILHTQDLFLTDNLDLGNIRIQKAKELQNVVVTGQKKLFERKVDRLVFNVENSISATGGDALDALKVTPGVQVQNDRISLIGKSGMSVLVDDRPVQLSGEDLVNYLRSIPSGNIKSIEVITTPPAKYDAQGNSGIINIQLKKAKNDSWNLTLRNSLTQATYFWGNAGASFILQKGRWSLLAGITQSYRKDIYTNELTYQYPEEYWEVQAHNINKVHSTFSNINAGYKITDNLSVGLLYNGTISDDQTAEVNKTHIYNNNSLDVLTKFYDNNGKNQSNPYNHAFNFNAQQKLDTLGKKINLDVDYFINNRNKQNPFYTTNYQYFSPIEQENYFTSNNSTQKITNFSTRLDFEMPYKWGKLNYGGKISFTEETSRVDGSFYQTVANTNNLYLFQKDHFIYKENNEALYLSLEKKLGEKWFAKAGLRMEATQTKGVSHPLGQSEQTHKKDYIKLFPTAYILYNPTDNHSFALSYSRRIQRPAYWELNPAKWYQSLNEVVYGNPFLQPSFTQNLSFTHTYKDLLASTIQYSYTENGFGQLVTHDANGNVFLIRENYYNSWNFGASENINLNLFPWWTNSSGFTGWYSEADAYSQYLQPKYSGWGASFNTNNFFSLNKTKTLSAEFSFQHNFPVSEVNFHALPSSSMSLGLRYLTLNKKLQFSLRVNNILDSDRQRIEGVIQGVDIFTKQYYDTRYVRLSVSYKFGNDKIRINQREGSNSEEKGRVN
ncbi:MAG: TonB-dependent receptor [Flavobacteriaceae bacterium]|jgi:outer membrane receptor protein involved in Fe transport|nr:TonB-dependent receptor [Flavobacteriaceae bacterium]